MSRLRLLTITSLAVLSSCSRPDAALRVNVTVRAQGAARVRADCIRLTISDDTQELKSLTIRRPADDDAVFGVRRGSDLPPTVKVQATGFLGSNCGDESTLALNAQGEVVTGVFPESGVTELSVFLDPPNTSLDGDRDGYVGAARGGLDCKDDDNTVFPGAGQICANTADTDCDGQGGCDDSECGTAAVCADPPDRVVITTAVATMLRYECRGPFRVELHNANGVRRAIRDTMVTLSASLPGVTVHGTSSCGMPVTALPIPYDSSFFEVYLSADPTAFGINTLTATAALVPTPGTANVEVHPQPIDRLEFTTSPRTVTAGACSTEAVTMEFRDSMNRRTDVDAPTTLTLSSAPGDVDNANIFFSDTGCMTAGDMQMLSPGQGSVTVYLLVRRAGSFQLTATPSAGTLATQPLTVQPAVPAKLAFTNSPVALNSAQSCSAGLFTVQLQDQFDNPVNAPASVTVRVSVMGLMNVLLYEPTGSCTTAAQTDFTISAGSNAVSFRAQGMVANPNMGTIRATSLSGGSIAEATQTISISAGNASRFILGGLPQNPLASVCSANALIVTLQDSAGNMASSPTPVTFALSTVPANTDTSFQFYTGAGCQTALNGMLTIPAGQTSANFYYRGNRTNPNFEIRASSTLTAPSTFLPGNSIRPGPPGKLQFAAPLAQTTQAGVCTPSPYVANVLDIFDNPTSFTTAQTVTVSSNPAGATVGSSACNSGNSVLLGANMGQVSFTAQHTVTNPSYALTATVSGFSTAMPATMTVTPGPSTLIVDVPAGASSTLMAGGCQQITLSRRDMFNNNAPTSGNTPVNLQFPAGTTWNVYANSTCSGAPVAGVNMNSTYTVTFSVSPNNNSAGAQVVTASIGSGVNMQSAVVNFQVNPGAPTLVFTTPATNLGTAALSAAAGTCTPITIARRDNFQNDVPLGSAANVTFPSLPAGTTIHSGSPCLPGNVITTIPLTATDARASFFVYATRSSPSGGPQLQNVISTLAAQSANLSLTVSPQASSTSLNITLPVAGTASLLARQCQRVNTERRDAFNNLVPAAGMNLTVTPAAGDMQTFSSTDCTGTANGTIAVTAGASNRDFSLRLDMAGASPRNLTVSHEGLTAPLALTISPAATSLFLIQGLPASMVSGACVGPLTLRRRDSYGNDTTSGTISVTMASTGTAPVTFSTASDCSGATATLNVGIADLASTSGSFYLTATQAAAAAISATQGSAMGSGSFMVNAGPPAQIVFTTGVRTFTASVCGGMANVITVQLRDAAGNVTNATGGGVAFQAVSTSGTASWWTNQTCATAASGGNFTVPNGSSSLNLFYRDTTVGTPTISISSALTNPAPQMHSVVPGPAARLAFTTVARTFTAAQCGGAANEIIVQLQDANGNPVSAGGSGQVFTAVTSSAGPAAWFTDSSCTTLSATGAFTIPNGMNSVSLFYRDDRAGTPTLTLTNGSSLTNPTGQQQTVNAGPPARLVISPSTQTLAALNCGTIVTVTMQDAGGNVVNAGSSRTIQLAASVPGPNIMFYSNSGCSSAIPSDQLTMAANASSVTFYWRAENAGSATITADTASITQGTLAATITAAPVTQLNITTAPATIEAGFCQPVAVERLDAINRQVTTGVTTITPTLAPATGASLFSDASCTVALGSSFTIPAASATTTVYLKGISGSLTGVVPGNQAYTFTMTTGGSITDNVVMTVQPMVRRRNSACTLSNATVSCAITPTLSDISRTMLFFQATPDGANDNAGDDNVTCRLDPNGGTAQVVCDRNGTGNLSIEWQTVSFPYSYANGGVTVQHVTGGCTAMATNTMPNDVTISSAPLANSFVLFSSQSTANDNDGEHFFTAQLTSATNLRFSQAGSSTTCTRTVAFDAQVVSWASSTVTRGVQVGGSGSSFTAATTGATSPVFLLYSSRLSDSNNQNICRRRLRGEITNGTTLTFARGCTGADIQDIAWEHVKLPTGGATVQQVHGNTSSGSAATANLTISSVDLTRTVGFLGGMGPGGTAGGATNYSATDRLGAALARVTFNNSTQVVYTRAVSDLVGQFTGYVVQFNP